MANIKYTENTVYNTLKNRHSIEEKIYFSSNMDALDVLIDMDRLLKIAKLTPYQRRVLDLYYLQGYQMHQIAKIVGVKHHTNISMAIKNAKKKIRKVLCDWGELKDE